MTILVIGTGSIGSRHASNLATLGEKVKPVSMRAVGMEGALAQIRSGLRGAVIATETQVRLPLIAACADADVPMYIEKPLAFDPVELAEIMAVAAPVAARSLVGFMMRYHPTFRDLAAADLSDTYRFSFDIGHDVTQWRNNWRFSDSYAARPKGGGVLLDLCHELDMATCLFPMAQISAVDSIGHSAYPGVDMATRITLDGAALGMVSMDYLSPVSTRKIDIAGAKTRRSIDLLSIAFVRNEMFLAAMRDWLALIDGHAVNGVEHLPRLDRVQDSCARIVAAWQARHFVGYLAGEKP